MVSTAVERYGRRMEFMPEKCVGCGVCEEVCPKNAVSIYRNGKGFMAKINEKCVVCGVCADFCFYGALRHEGSVYKELLEEIEFRRVEVDERLCILCGRCMRECPRGAIKVVRNVDVKKLRKGSIKIGGGCIECELCVDICPTKAVRLSNSKPSISEDKCIYCEMCSRICPMNVLEIRCDSCRNFAERSYAVSGKIILDERACSMCGVCQEVCPIKAISVAKLLRGEQEWFRELCISHCTVCRDVCPNLAIEYLYLPEKTVKFNERCNFCGTCMRFCPSKAIRISRETPIEPKVEFREIERRRKKVIRVREGRICSGCGFCTSFCPLRDREVLEIVNGSVLEKETEDCVACGLCVKNCPSEALEVLEASN